MARRAGDWMRRAERDFRHARNALEHGDYEWTCFAAQQAAEKTLKALYEQEGWEARGYSILGLLRGLKNSYEVPDEFYPFARLLTRYYIEARYPNGFPERAPFEYFDEEMAQEAVRAAEAILRVEIFSVDARALRQRLEEIATRIRREHPKVQTVLPFGSFARGDFTPHSDVDVAILLSRNNGEPFLARADVFMDYFAELPLDVNLLVYTREEIDRMLAEGNRLAKAVVEGVPLGREEV